MAIPGALAPGIFLLSAVVWLLSFVFKSLTKKLIRLILSVSWLTFTNQRKWLNSAVLRR